MSPDEAILVKRLTCTPEYDMFHVFSSEFQLKHLISADVDMSFVVDIWTKLGTRYTYIYIYWLSFGHEWIITSRIISLNAINIWQIHLNCVLSQIMGMSVNEPCKADQGFTYT